MTKIEILLVVTCLGVLSVFPLLFLLSCVLGPFKVTWGSTTNSGLLGSFGVLFVLARVVSLLVNYRQARGFSLLCVRFKNEGAYTI